MKCNGFLNYIRRKQKNLQMKKVMILTAMLFIMRHTATQFGKTLAK